MKYIINIMNTIKNLTKELPKPMGRWKIENCSKQVNNKIDLSNEDHCGPCGQYALEKIESKNNNIESKNNNIDIHTKKLK